MHSRTPVHLDGLGEAGALTEAAMRAAEEFLLAEAEALQHLHLNP